MPGTSSDVRQRSNKKTSKGQKKQQPSLPPQVSAKVAHDLITESNTFSFSLKTAFRLFLIIRCASGLYSVVQDCDEVFNYWEPVHYLLEGYGFQTWEYSPRYSIRSWAYILIYSLFGFLAQLISSTKLQIFYLIRLLMAAFCSFAEAKLYRTVVEEINPHVARYLMVALFFSAGMFHASTALLPSTFAMYTTMMAFSSILQPPTQMDRTRTYTSVFWLVLGGLAWPFSGVIGIPFAIEEVVVYGRDTKTDKHGQLQVAVRSQHWRYLRVLRLVEAVLLSTLVLGGTMFLIDSTIYQQWTFVPWNIVRYNVFSGADGRGPDLFGTEPWYFYILNGFLNFNVVFLLALASGIIMLVTAYVDRHRVPGTTWTDAVWPYLLMSFKLAPFYLWFLIFTCQPHKEERFLYVAYPLIALNAAIAIYFIRSLVSRGAGYLGANINVRVYILRYTSLAILVVYGLVSISRILALVTRYHAPLTVYNALWKERQEPLVHSNYIQERYAEDMTTKELQLCVGKEWYRYQSSFFLPNDVRLRFIPSHFDGLLPNTFPEDRTTATYIDKDTTIHYRTRNYDVLKGMRHHHDKTNDRNQPDDSATLKDLTQCDYMVDSYFPLHRGVESSFVMDKAWDRVFCEPYLDAAHSRQLARAFWVPGSQGLQWGEYCLLKRKT
ncbi:Alg9-like mannosyltransferase family-domain-containing protein [Halteromyces radiatus]|uniref:Alg9-like mannosyltransferase family-domain-containing protein n=1 Tax=Halteromyces radiatus TaxID=101107 RepID=UPI00221F386F|nr:Alg9-like mannosyltransferase family-domain-containing protein [Halteromyces radiatus]KAI8099158.1 Alg9-like mannosyltransferase family-domain-containing protein [Halteromyces radiatus]